MTIIWDPLRSGLICDDLVSSGITGRSLEGTGKSLGRATEALPALGSPGTRLGCLWEVSGKSCGGFGSSGSRGSGEVSEAIIARPLK